MSRPVDDPADLRRGEALAAEPNAFPVAVGAQQSHREVDEDVGATPFPSVHAGHEADGGPAAGAGTARANAEGVAASLLPRQVRQRDPLEVAGVVLFSEHHARLPLRRS